MATSTIASPQLRLVAGCMTGTSIDGLDIALVAVEGSGLGMRALVKRCLSRPLGELGDRLRRVANQEPLSAAEITAIAHEFAFMHVKLLKELIASERVALIALHGQTVFHQPPLSWQLLDPVPIAYGLGVPVVSGLRAADLALGGRGAPITPLADYVLFSAPYESRCIVNLGGFCNLTLLPAGGGEPKDDEGAVSRISGRDVCVCNQLLDMLARRLVNLPFDPDGKNAAAGTVQSEPFEELRARLSAQASEARSLGTGDELADWLHHFQDRHRAEDILSSACAAIGAVIAREAGTAERIILSGGGVRNRTLVGEISSRSNSPVELSDSYGVPSTHREAAAMAVLGALCQDRVPITLSQVTGVRTAPMSGVSVFP